MVLGCTANCVKFLIVFFNFLAFAAGAAILGGSIAAYVGDPIKQYINDAITQEISNYSNYKTLLIFGMVRLPLRSIFCLLSMQLNEWISDENVFYIFYTCNTSLFNYF